MKNSTKLVNNDNLIRVNGDQEALDTISKMVYKCCRPSIHLQSSSAPTKSRYCDNTWRWQMQCIPVKYENRVFFMKTIINAMFTHCLTVGSVVVVIGWLIGCSFAQYVRFVLPKTPFCIAINDYIIAMFIGETPSKWRHFQIGSVQIGISPPPEDCRTRPRLADFWQVE